MAYKEYRKYKANMISGAVLFPVGAGLFIGGMVEYDDWGDEWIGMWVPGLAVMTTGLIQLCLLNHPLKKSYQYYINGDQKTATLNFHPYIGGNHTFGAGLTLRF